MKEKDDDEVDERERLLWSFLFIRLFSYQFKQMLKAVFCNHYFLLLVSFAFFIIKKFCC